MSSVAGEWEDRLASLVSAPAALAVGVGVRLWFYFLNDSFWRDESMLLLNISQHSLTELLGPLDYAQEAPIPLLWLCRGIFLLGAGGEMPMRAFSLLCSILALLLFYGLAKRVLLERRAVLFAAWLLALAPGAILFAAQAKPYSFDLLVASGLLYLATPLFINPRGAPQISRLAGVAGLAPWFSLPSIFVAAGIGVGLLSRARRCGYKPGTIFLAVVSLSFSLEYFLVLKRSLGLQPFIREWLLRFTVPGLQWAFSQTFYAYLGPRGHFWSPGLWAVAGLGMWGIWEAGRRNGWAWSTVLILPLLLALGASAAGLYPVFGRLLLFATPGLYLLVGYGVARVFRIIPWPRVLALALFILIFPCVQASLAAYGRPVGGVREALQFIGSRQQPQDLVLCDSYALPTIAYYQLLNKSDAMNLRCELDVKDWSWGRVDPWQLRPERLLPLIPPEKRVWLVAETLDYARAGVTQVLPYWQQLTARLKAEREPMASFITERVQVWGFFPRIKQP